MHDAIASMAGTKPPFRIVTAKQMRGLAAAKSCSGWQTEGWFSKDIKSNIAGFLGTLDFKLDSKKGRLLRRNLKYDTTAKDESIQIRLKSDTELKISIKANGKMLIQNKIEPSNQYQNLKMNLSDSIWKNTINALDLQFEGEKGAFVTIDYIKLNRLN